MCYYHDTFSRGEKIILEIKSPLIFRPKFLSVQNKRHIHHQKFTLHTAILLLASITPRFVTRELSVKLIGSLLRSDLTVYFA